ncbi:MAG: YraN family protein [Vulcanibacillus sp.]
MIINKRYNGKCGENKAKEYLISIGYLLIEENWQNRYGEIDLIMFDNGKVVFVEVRTKNNSNYGTALESINRKKQLQIVKMVSIYLQNKNWWDKPYRIDVIAIDKKEDFYNLAHVKNAVEI